MTAAIVEASCSRDEPLKIVGEVNAPIRLAARVSLVLAAVCRRQVIDPGQHRAEEFAVVHHAADGDPAEPDAVVALFAPDQA